jgi:protease-4
MFGRKGPRVLELRLSHDVPETSSGLTLLSGGGAPFYEVEYALRRVAEDARVSGVLVKLEELDLGWSRAESLHRALLGVRQASKTTVAYVTGGGNAAFLVASACERILLQPSSTLMLQSLSAEGFFLRDFLGEVGVRPQIDHVGEYKSAGEMFLRREMSPEHRSEIDEILASLHEQIVTRIAAGRGVNREDVERWLRAGPFTADEAVDEGLVDRLAYEDGCVDVLEEALGERPRLVEDGSHRARPGWFRRLWRRRRPRVAVVHACGVLTMGRHGRPSGRGRAIGARSLAGVLESLRKDRRVKAVVVRVDTPGGSAVASDVVHRAFVLTSKEKPVVVSMGDVAASGGYYIASAAHAIVAEGPTLTGSIGVIGGKFSFDRILDRLGIYRETRALGTNASFLSPLQPFSEEERAWHRRSLAHFYEKRFLPVVMEGRSLDFERADRVGRGRVWTGRQGLEHGLVDVLGGLDDAIRLARDRAGLAPGRTNVVFHAPRRRWRELLGVAARDGVSKGTWGELTDWLEVVSDLAREEILLLMPRMFRIR